MKAYFISFCRLQNFLCLFFSFQLSLLLLFLTQKDNSIVIIHSSRSRCWLLNLCHLYSSVFTFNIVVRFTSSKWSELRYLFFCIQWCKFETIFLLNLLLDFRRVSKDQRRISDNNSWRDWFFLLGFLIKATTDPSFFLRWKSFNLLLPFFHFLHLQLLS